MAHISFVSGQADAISLKDKQIKTHFEETNSCLNTSFDGAIDILEIHKNFETLPKVTEKSKEDKNATEVDNHTSNTLNKTSGYSQSDGEHKDCNKIDSLKDNCLKICNPPPPPISEKSSLFISSSNSDVNGTFGVSTCSQFLNTEVSSKTIPSEISTVTLPPTDIKGDCNSSPVEMKDKSTIEEIISFNSSLLCASVENSSDNSKSKCLDLMSASAYFSEKSENIKSRVLPQVCSENKNVFIENGLKLREQIFEELKETDSAVSNDLNTSKAVELDSVSHQTQAVCDLHSNSHEKDGKVTLMDEEKDHQPPNGPVSEDVSPQQSDDCNPRDEPLNCLEDDTMLLDHNNEGIEELSEIQITNSITLMDHESVDGVIDGNVSNKMDEKVLFVDSPNLNKIMEVGVNDSQMAEKDKVIEVFSKQGNEMVIDTKNSQSMCNENSLMDEKSGANLFLQSVSHPEKSIDKSDSNLDKEVKTTGQSCGFVEGDVDRGIEEKTAKHGVDSKDNNHKDSRNSNNSFDEDDDILFIDESDTLSLKESIGLSSETKVLSVVSTQLDSDNSDKLVSDEKAKTNNIPENSESQRKRLNSDDSQSSVTSKRHKSNVSDEKSVKEIGNCIIIAGDKQDPSKLDESDSTGTHIEITSEVLQAFISARLKAFLKDRKHNFIEKLNKRTRNMQSATNLWKETAKHLERSVMDLSLLGQKIDQRKNHPSASKNVGNRSIGTQVDECQAKQSPVVATGSPNRRKDSLISSTALSLPPSVLLNPAQNQNLNPKHQQMSSNSVTSNMHRPGVRGRPPSASGPQNRLGKVPLQQNNSPRFPSSPSPRLTTAPPSKTIQQGARFPVVNQTSAHLFNNSNLIDLTDEDDVSKKSGKTAPTHSLTPVSPRTVKSLSTAQTNGYVHNGTIPANAPPVLLGQNSQFLGSGSSSITGSPIQLVPLNPNTSSRGPVFALLPGARPSAPVAAPFQPRNAPMSSSNVSTNVPATTKQSLPPSFHLSSKHPAPLPSHQDVGNAPPNAKCRPPKPVLRISQVSQGIVLSWNMPSLDDSEKIASYQLFAYQETETSIPKSTLWKKVGDVKALPLPMACTLTQFQQGNKYHFAVRAVDQYGRCGLYSDSSSIFLGLGT